MTKRSEKVPELAEFKFSKDLIHIPVHEHFEHVTKRDVLSDEEIRKAVQVVKKKIITASACRIKQRP